MGWLKDPHAVNRGLSRMLGYLGDAIPQYMMQKQANQRYEAEQAAEQERWQQGYDLRERGVAANEGWLKRSMASDAAAEAEKMRDYKGGLLGGIRAGTQYKPTLQETMDSVIQGKLSSGEYTVEQAAMARAGRSPKQNKPDTGLSLADRQKYYLDYTQNQGLMGGPVMSFDEWSGQIAPTPAPTGGGLLSGQPQPQVDMTAINTYGSKKYPDWDQYSDEDKKLIYDTDMAERSQTGGASTPISHLLSGERRELY